jgi:carbonic anhydrase
VEVDALLAANERFAASFDRGELSAPPRRSLAVLACMDARLDPVAALGLEPGDAHVLRNAGGRASGDALRSLRISTHLLGVREVVVIHHTGCGLEGLDEARLRRIVRGMGGEDPGKGSFLGFAELDGSVREDVETIRSAPGLPAGLIVSGLVYDVASGRLRVVEGPSPAR